MYKIMRVPEKGKAATPVSMLASFNGDPYKVDFSHGYSICASVTDATAVDGDTFVSGVLEVQTMTFPAYAAVTNNDYIKFSDSAGGSWAVALGKPIYEVQTLTFPSVAGSTAGDYIVLTDAAGLTWAAALNKTGADPAPTGAIYTAVNAARKVNVDISGGTDAASVAALVETALNALTGFSAAFTTNDGAADGTMIVTMDVYGPCANPVPKNADDSGAGSILGVETTAGVALTAPSGAIYTAVAAANKVVVDLTAGGATTAASVAALVETAVDALTGLSAVITTDDSAANGTMLFTQVVRGPTTDPVPKNADDSGAGGILGVQSTAGVTSNVNLGDDEITIVDHNFHLGLKIRLTTSSALPTGLAAATDYFVIPVDDDTFQLAASLVDAVAGTEIDITGFGTGTHTVDVQEDLTGTLKLQASNNCFADNTSNELRSDTVWVDIPNTSVSLDGGNDSVVWNVGDVYYEAVRIVWTRTVGTGSALFYFVAKGDG